MISMIAPLCGTMKMGNYAHNAMLFDRSAEACSHPVQADEESDKHNQRNDAQQPP